MGSRRPSAADERVISEAALAGVRVTARQLERWRQHGAIPIARRTWLGRGRGSSSAYEASDVLYIVEFARLARPKLRPSLIAIWLFLKRIDVPEPVLRRALLDEFEFHERLVWKAAGTNDPHDAADALARKLTKSRSTHARPRRLQTKATYHRLAETGQLEPVEDLVRDHLEPPTIKYFEERVLVNTIQIGLTGEALDTTGLAEAAVFGLQGLRLDGKPDIPEADFIDGVATSVSNFTMSQIALVAREAPFVALILGRNLLLDWEPLATNYPVDLSRPPEPLDVHMIVAAAISLRVQLSEAVGEPLEFEDVIRLVLEHETAGQAADFDGTHSVDPAND